MCKAKVLSVLLLCSSAVLANNKQEFIKNKSPEEVFTAIYEKNFWGDKESISGKGSSLQATQLIRESLPALLKKYAIKSILDIPCGDFNWLSKINLDDYCYLGVDIVKPLIDNNNRLYGNDLKMRYFRYGNAITDKLPKVDLILCRDLLIHFDFESIFKTLKNFKKSGSRYILVTTHLHSKKNKDITMGRGRGLNLQKAPFHFPKPLCLLQDKRDAQDEKNTKYLGLWKLEDIPF